MKAQKNWKQIQKMLKTLCKSNIVKIGKCSQVFT